MSRPSRGAAAALTPALRAVAAGSLTAVIASHPEPMAAVRHQLVVFVDRRVESPEAAEDIVQDVFERLQRACPGTITNIQLGCTRRLATPSSITIASAETPPPSTR